MKLTPGHSKETKLKWNRKKTVSWYNFVSWNSSLKHTSETKHWNKSVDADRIVCISWAFTTAIWLDDAFQFAWNSFRICILTEALSIIIQISLKQLWNSFRLFNSWFVSNVCCSETQNKLFPFFFCFISLLFLLYILLPARTSRPLCQ